MKIIKLMRCEFIKNFFWKKSLIILIVLLISCFGLIKLESFFGNQQPFSMVILSSKSFDKGYNTAEKEYQTNSNLIQKGILDIFNRISPSYKKAYELVGSNERSLWQKDVVDYLRLRIPQLIVLNQMKSNYQDPIFQQWLDDDIKIYYYDDDLYNEYAAQYTNSIKKYIGFSYQEILSELEGKEKIVELLEQSLHEEAYYIYQKAVYEEGLLLSIKNNTEIPLELKQRYDYIIDNHIMDEDDYRVKNANLYYQYFSYEIKIPTLNDYNENSFIKYGDYETTKKFYSNLKGVNEYNKKIIDYAYKNELKPDLYSPDDNVVIDYNSSKEFMNQGLHLGIIITLLIVILHSGIIAREHDKGTIKLLLTTPIKRSKILFSKLLYLILETYLLWIIGSIIMFLLVGFHYGFSDLLTPKLIVSGGDVIEINYIFWYLKEMLICMIPISCFIVILFSLSTISLNTSLTASILSIISVISITIWMLISNFGMVALSFLSYTPIPYLDFWFVRYNSKYYLQAISNTTLGSNYGIWISLIVGIILYFITNIIYSKRDIKN